MHTEIAEVPKFIKKRLYEHIEQYARTHKLADDEYMRLIAQDVGCEVYHHANRTTKLCAYKNSLRYARVPMGASCAFCLMLASRGFVYHTRTSAGEDKGHYHSHCHCKIIAGDTNTTIEGYDPYGITTRMCDISQSIDIAFDWKDYIADPHIQRQIQQELITRDPMWVLTGKVPEIEFESELARKNVRQHEIEQAKRLSAHGIKCIFQVDYEVDEATRGTARQRIIGKPDLKNGIELKSLTNVSNLRGHIGKALRNAAKKNNVTCCHFDAYGTQFTDEEIIDALNIEMKLRNVKNASFMGKDGSYYKLKI